VVPCFNEEHRLDESKFESLINSGLVTLLFVDDCSTDMTEMRIQSIKSKWPSSVEVFSLNKNGGKGEAVRVGLLRAIGAGFQHVGFMDADFAVPPEEVIRFLNEANNLDGKQVFLGSRVKLLGSQISRTFKRHLFGRVFATVASLVTKIDIYDSQCGLKVFTTNSNLKSSLETPFRTRWLFDLELLQRLNSQQVGGIDSGRLQEVAAEIPLRRWDEVSGTKFSLAAQIKSIFQLLLLIKH
jgi:glycosyltransferase involved in cell wall biosynthesis